MSMQWKARAMTTAQADELRATQDVSKKLFSSGAVVRLDVDWHGLQWLLAGDLWKPTSGAGSAIMGGTPVGEDLYGYGPARLLSGSEVDAIAAGLRELPADDLRLRYDLKAIRKAEPYPFYNRWKKAHLDDYLLPAYTKLTAFYAKAAKTGSAVASVIY